MPLGPPVGGSGLQYLIAQLAANLGQNLGQGVAGISQGLQARHQQDALVNALAGQQGQFNPAVSSLDIRQDTGAPGYSQAVAGLLQGLPREQIANFVQAGLGPQLAEIGLRQMLPGEGYTLGAGDVRFDASGRPVAGVPAETGPASAAGKIAQDIGVDIKTPEGQAAVSAIAKAMQASTTINVGEKPVTGPAGVVLAQTPGTLAEVNQVEGVLFPASQFSREVATKMLAPGTDEGAIDDVFTAGIMQILRGESGGVINEGEIAQKQQIYRPSPIDSEARARAKFNRFKRDLERTLGVAERGRSPEEKADVPPVLPEEPGMVSGLLNQGVEAARGMLGGMTGGGDVPVVQDQAAYDALPPGAKYTVGDGVTRTKGAR